MREIQTKFKSCIEDNIVDRETIIFKALDGKKLGEVVLKRIGELKTVQVAGDPDRFLFECIESWTFKDKNGKPLELNIENLKRLKGAYREDGQYKNGIAAELFIIANEINFPSEAAEKNSEKR